MASLCLNVRVQGVGRACDQRLGIRQGPVIEQVAEFLGDEVEDEAGGELAEFLATLALEVRADAPHALGACVAVEAEVGRHEVSRAQRG